MKRVILILFVAAAALVLWNKFSTGKTTHTVSPQENVSAQNPILDRVNAKRAQRTPQEEGKTDTVVYDEQEPEIKRLTPEQIEAYLLKTKRSPESLLNALWETADTNYLAEAVKNFPDNPLVQWTMLWRGSPEERASWLEKLKASSPDNVLPNYLSALDSFKSGNIDKALAEMDSGSSKHYSAFEKERAQSREEMYLMSGFSPLEARIQGMEAIVLPNVSEMKALAQEISALQQKYTSAGDTASAQQLAVLGIEASRKLCLPNESFLINTLVGMSMEMIALKNLDANTHYGFLGRTAGERQQELKNQKQEMKDLAGVHDNNYSQLSDVEKMIYTDRLRLYGELNAMKWLKKYSSDSK